MADLIFAYEVQKTNWLNPDWLKARKREIHRNDLLCQVASLEFYFPNKTNHEKAKIMGISVHYYYKLKRGYEGG